MPNGPAESIRRWPVKDMSCVTNTGASNELFDVSGFSDLLTGHDSIAQQSNRDEAPNKDI